MTTLEKCKDEIAVKHNYENWDEMLWKLCYAYERGANKNPWNYLLKDTENGLWKIQ